MEALTDRERDIIDLERGFWRYAGMKEQAIKERFDLTTVAYYQLLNRIIHKEAALAYDPVTVRRLLRMQKSRLKQRASRNAPE